MATVFEKGWMILSSQIFTVNINTLKDLKALICVSQYHPNKWLTNTDLVPRVVTEHNLKDMSSELVSDFFRNDSLT